MSIVAPPLSNESLSMVGDFPPDRAIGSLWRRVAAFVADAIILGIVGNLLAFPFFEAFSHLGAWGRLVGFCVALPYFALMDSTIGNGNTLGKRWLRLQVVDVHGNTISFGKSVVRYVFFAVPYFLNDISLPVTRTPWIVSDLIYIVVIAVGGANFYLVFFNRHTRQGIHDLMAGSYVAEAGTIGPLRTQSIWKIHWAILTFLIVVLSLTTGILGSKLEKRGQFPQMLQDVRLVEGMANVQRAGVQDLTPYNFGGGASEQIFVINTYWTGTSADEEAFANRVAKLILQSDPSVRAHDLLRVVMIRSYDIGIASAHVSHTFEHTPAQWELVSLLDH